VLPVKSFFQISQKIFFDELKRPVITNSFEEKIFSIKAEPAAPGAGEQGFTLARIATGGIQ